MKVWKTLLIYAISLLLLFLFFRDVDMKSLKGLFLRIPPIYPLAFAFSIFLNMLIRAYRWRVLVEPYKPDVSLGSLYHSTVIGYLITYALPGRLGEIARPVLLGEKEGIRKAQLLATVVFERIVDTLLVLFLFLASLAFLPAGIASGLARFRHLALVASGILLGILIWVIYMTSSKGMAGAERLVAFGVRLGPRRYRQRLSDAFLRFIRALNPRLTVRQVFRFGAWTLCLWLVVIFFFWVLSWGVPGVRMGIEQLLLFFSFIYVASGIPLPGLAGSLDLASRFVLTTFIAVDEQPAVAYTLLFHFLLIAVTFILGITSLWKEGLHFSRIRLLRKNHEMP